MKLGQFDVDPWTGQPLTAQVPDFYSMGPAPTKNATVSEPVDWKNTILVAAVTAIVTIVVGKMLK